MDSVRHRRIGSVACFSEYMCAVLQVDLLLKMVSSETYPEAESDPAASIGEVSLPSRAWLYQQ